MNPPRVRLRFREIAPWPAASALFVGLALWEMHDESVTTDELVHVTAGYAALTRKDFRLNTEHPPLAKALAALPLSFMDLRWPVREDYWDQGLQWQHSYLFFHQSGNDPDRLLRAARLPMLFWGVLLLGAVWGLARELFGTPGAYVALALAAFSPMLLSHGHLVTTDVPVAALLVLSAAALRRLVEAPSAARAVVAGTLLGGALLAKYNAAIFLPAFAWYLAAEAVRNRPPRGARLGYAARWAGCLALMGACSFALLWAAYGFRFRVAADPAFELAWNFQRTGDGAVGRAIAFARAHRLLPEAYLHGFAYMFEHAQGRTAYALGRLSPTGWWWYFPFAYLVKTPVSALALTLAGLAWALRAPAVARTSFLVVPVVFYWIVAAGASINIGLRHMIPVFPFMMVLAGGLPYERLLRSSRRAVRWGMAAILALVPLETLAAAPYFLAYFNLPSTLAADRHFLLADSNLDWGQDLRRLKRWMDRHGIERLKLAYFGNASPRLLGLRHDRLMAANMYQDYEPEWKLVETIHPGDWVAVSATNYAGIVLGPRADHYRKLLAGLSPVTAIGHSILVFHIPPGWRPPEGVPGGGM